MHSLSIESYVLISGQISEDLGPGCSISDNSERLHQRGRARKPGHTGIFDAKLGSQNFKRLLLIKENQMSQSHEVE